MSNVVTMYGLFAYSQFNGDISQWNTSHVKDMSFMFLCSQFNGDISQRDMPSATDLSWMFWESQFNGDISLWNVSEDAYMKLMSCRSPLELEHGIPKWYKP